jgi:ATP/maltotriose-dependent transcriptional regulator MalT
MMNQGMEAAQKLGVSMFMPFLKCRMAEIMLSLDRIDESERAVAEAEAIMNRTGERNYEGELRRLKGELHWRNGRIEEAGLQFREALEIARRQQAKAVELRATTSYGRFLAAAGQSDQARALVESADAWFDEGTDGHDRTEARAAIAELRSAAGPVERRAV